MNPSNLLSTLESTDSWKNIEESHAAKLAKNSVMQDSHKTRTILKRDKERYVRGLTNDVKGCLNTNALRPAFQALMKLHSKFPSSMSTIQSHDGKIESHANRYWNHWAKYFMQLYTVEPQVDNSLWLYCKWQQLIHQ